MWRRYVHAQHLDECNGGLTFDMQPGMLLLLCYALRQSASAQPGHLCVQALACVLQIAFRCRCPVCWSSVWPKQKESGTFAIGSN